MLEKAVSIQSPNKIKKSSKSRYYFNDMIVDDNKQTLYDLFEPLDYTNITDGVQYIVVQTHQENRLDIISYEMYGDSTYWWLIAMANQMIDPFTVIRGTALKIPPISSFIVGGSLT